MDHAIGQNLPNVISEYTSSVVIHSGGAQGADSCFAKHGVANGMRVFAHSWDKHSATNIGTIVKHTDQELRLADDLLSLVNKKYVFRTFPAASEHVNNLLRRNYCQIKDSQGVVAITRIDNKGIVMGGTAWAVYMAVEKGLPCFVFDLVDNKWKKWDGVFVDIEKPDLFDKAFAGIGSRDLGTEGEKEIINYLARYSRVCPIKSPVQDHWTI